MSGGAKFSDQEEALAQLGQEVFIVQVAPDGKILRDGIEVTEDELKQEALAWIMEDPDTKAILLVHSSQLQGIHLTALLSEVGFTNVTVYYPTASVQK